MQTLQDLKTDIGKQVKALREGNDLSQEPFANQTGKGITYISELENGKENPTIQTLWEIGNKMGAEVEVRFVVK